MGWVSQIRVLKRWSISGDWRLYWKLIMSSWPSKNEEVGRFVNYEKCCQSAAALSSSGRRLLSRLMLVWSELVIKYSAISDRHTHKHCSEYLTLHNRAMQVILLPRKKQKELTTWCRTSSTASRSRWPRLPAAPRCCRRWRRRRAGTWTVETVVSCLGKNILENRSDSAC